MGVGQGQVEHVGVEIASAGGTAMLRIGHLKFSRPAGHRIAQIVQRPMGCPKPIRPASAPGTGASPVIPRPSNDLGRGKVFDASHAFGGVGNIASRAIHDRASVKSFSRRYRPTPDPKARKSSVTVLQSPIKPSAQARVSRPGRPLRPRHSLVPGAGAAPASLLRVGADGSRCFPVGRSIHHPTSRCQGSRDTPLMIPLGVVPRHESSPNSDLKASNQRMRHTPQQS